MKEIYGIFGSGGYGREVLPIALQNIKKSSLYFVVDEEFYLEKYVNDIPVITYRNFINLTADKKYISVAIADGLLRKTLFERFERDKLHHWNLIASNTFLIDNSIIKPGVILSPFTSVTANTRIGRGFHANLYSYIAHDCFIGDFVTLAPGVKCSGNVHISDLAYIGTGAIIKPGNSLKPIIIGKNAVVGMGAIVTKDVPDGATVFGNPAKIIKR